MTTQAMLLAAGRGSRMGALTDDCPKPLLRIEETTLIGSNLMALAAAGVEQVVINVSYHADQLMEALGQGEAFGLQIIYSQEPEGALGTGGGIVQALPHFKGAPFLLLSADVWTDYDFAQLRALTQTADEQTLAHLVLVDNPAYHRQGDYGLSDAGRIVSTVRTRLTYAGFGWLHPRLFTQREAPAVSFSPYIQDAMAAGQVAGSYYAGPWFNVGTPTELARVRAHVAQRNSEAG